MQVVYIYKLTEDTSELRYSLRSVEKYLNPDKVFLIGDAPDWMQNVTVIPFVEKTTIKNTNITQKIFEILKHNEIEESFLLFWDDIFLLEPFEHKAFTNGTLKQVLDSRKNHNKHWKALHNVFKIFPNGLNFDVHHPYLFEKKKIEIVKNKYLSIDTCLFASLYYNTFIMDCEILKIKDWKIRSMQQFNEMSKIQPALFSTVNSLLKTDAFLKKLNTFYPTKSKYEK